jgi:putative ABC transport system permease protein
MRISDCGFNMPDWKAEIRQRLASLKLKPTREAEIVEELAQHLDDRYRELLARGATDDQASRVALAELSGKPLLANELRRIERAASEESAVLGSNTGGNMLGDLVQDLRYGWRMLRKKPGFTAVAIIIMALGIGANTAIFSLVRAVLLRPLPFANPDRLVMVWEDATFIGFPKNTPAPANYADWKARNEVFEDMAALDYHGFNLTGDDEPEKVYAFGVTASFFPLLGVEPLLGRVLTAEDDRPEASKVVVISYPLWQSRYGGQSSIVGREILLNDEKYTVVGVMPRGFQFLHPEIRLWVPSGFTAKTLADRDDHYLQVVARIKPGVTLNQANSNIKTIQAQIERDYPNDAGLLGANVISLGEELTGETRRPLIVLLVAVAFVLLIASANLANLLLSRALSRTKEIAVRTALGGSRRRLVRQLLTESVLLSLAGGISGVLVAFWSFDFLRHLIPQGLSLFVDLRIDWAVLAFTLALSVITGTMFGLAPALQSSRVDLNEALKQGGGRTSLSAGHRRLQSAMVVGEVALAMVLLVGAGLLIKTFARLRDQYSGLRAERVLTLRTQLPEGRYKDAQRRFAFYEQVLERVTALPGVVAAYTTSVPLEWKGGTNSITIEGRPVEPGVIYDAIHRQISPDYFKAMGIALKQGRFFNEVDNQQSMPVVIINETMAREFWPDENALGKRFKQGGGNTHAPWATIVGIVADLRQMGAEAPVKAEMYLPYRQAVQQYWYAPRDLVIRTSVEPLSLAGAVIGKVHEVDADQPVSNIRTMKDVLGEQFGQRETGTTLLGVFAALAMLLAAIGLYGVLSYFVSQRIPEFGVRIALGAQSRDILWLVLKRGMGLALVGLAIGLAGSFALMRLIESLLFEVSASDPAVFGLIALLLAAAAFAACYIPVRRAMKIDPMVALRYE